MKNKNATFGGWGLQILIFLVGGWIQVYGNLSAQAQDTTYLTLDSCQHWARQHHPLADQYPLLAEISQLSQENIATHNYPEIKLAAHATYQSDVTGIPIDVPGIDLPQVPHDQYNANVEISQSLTRFKTTSLQKDQAKTQQAIQEKKVDVALYQLRNRINTLYFGILLLDAQLRQNHISQTDLDEKTNQLREAKKYGTVLQSDIDQLQATYLKLTQQEVNLRSRRQEWLTVLSQLTGRSISTHTRLIRPVPPVPPGAIQRPEMDLFRLQKQEIEQQKQLYSQQLKPRINFFLQGGYGRPALNFLSEEFEPYFLGGIRFQWNLSAGYNKNRQYEIWEVRKRMIDTESENFSNNTRINLAQYSEMIDRYQALIRLDRDIIMLRASVKETAEAQLAQGTITPLDYLAIFHEEEQARLDRELHQIQFLQSQYKWLYENGY